MADVVLKHVEKVYPFIEKENREGLEGLRKRLEEKTKKNNLQITENGVLAVQDFSIEIKDGSSSFLLVLLAVVNQQL